MRGAALVAPRARACRVAIIAVTLTGFSELNRWFLFVLFLPDRIGEGFLAPV